MVLLVRTLAPRTAAAYVTILGAFRGQMGWKLVRLRPDFKSNGRAARASRHRANSIILTGVQHLK